MSLAASTLFAPSLFSSKNFYWAQHLNKLLIVKAMFQGLLLGSLNKNYVFLTMCVHHNKERHLAWKGIQVHCNTSTLGSIAS